MRRLSIGGSACFLLLLCTGCGVDATAPDGFAVYEGRGAFRAVSPEGVVYRVRTVDNKPRADLEFWREALRKRMLDAGYRLLAEDDVRTGNLDGYRLELAAPVGEQDYAYLVAIFVLGDELLVAESAGEVSRFQTVREAVLEAVRTIDS